MSQSDSISITLASIVKNKAGLWVSEKQSKFIRSQCYDIDCYVAFTNAVRPSTLYYYLDDLGVVRVEKITASHKHTVEYDRNIDPNIAIRKRYLREIKRLETSIRIREIYKADYEKTDAIDIAELKNMIETLTSKINKRESNKSFFIDENLLVDFELFQEKDRIELQDYEKQLLDYVSSYDRSMNYDITGLNEYKKLLEENL